MKVNNKLARLYRTWTYNAFHYNNIHALLWSYCYAGAVLLFCGTVSITIKDDIALNKHVHAGVKYCQRSVNKQAAMVTYIF